MKKGKRVKEKKKNLTIKIAKRVLLIIILFLLFFIIKNKITEENIEFKEENTLSENITIQENLDQKEDNDLIIKKYKGYETIAKLKIPKIGVETYVISDFSKKALEVSVTKYWGPNPNEIGNFCIVGHNYLNNKMFGNVKKLNIGDEINLYDKINGQLQYEIYDIYKVKPTNVDCLSQETNNKKEITLITCSDNSNYRIIVKARKI